MDSNRIEDFDESSSGSGSSSSSSSDTSSSGTSSSSSSSAIETASTSPASTSPISDADYSNEDVDTRLTRNYNILKSMILQLQCPVCSNILHEPMKLKCCHVLCKECMQDDSKYLHCKKCARRTLRKRVQPAPQYVEAIESLNAMLTRCKLPLEIDSFEEFKAKALDVPSSRRRKSRRRKPADIVESLGPAVGDCPVHEIIPNIDSPNYQKTTEINSGPSLSEHKHGIFTQQSDAPSIIVHTPPYQNTDLSEPVVYKTSPIRPERISIESPNRDEVKNQQATIPLRKVLEKSADIKSDEKERIVTQQSDEPSVIVHTLLCPEPEPTLHTTSLVTPEQSSNELPNTPNKDPLNYQKAVIPLPNVLEKSADTKSGPLQAEDKHGNVTQQSKLPSSKVHTLPCQKRDRSEPSTSVIKPECRSNESKRSKINLQPVNEKPVVVNKESSSKTADIRHSPLHPKTSPSSGDRNSRATRKYTYIYRTVLPRSRSRSRDIRDERSRRKSDHRNGCPHSRSRKTEDYWKTRDTSVKKSGVSARSSCDDKYRSSSSSHRAVKSTHGFSKSSSERTSRKHEKRDCSTSQKRTESLHTGRESKHKYEDRKKRESSCREHRHNPVSTRPTVEKSVDEQQSKSSTLVDKDKTTISIKSVKAENRPAQLNKMIGKKRESSCREHRHNPVPAQPTVDKSVDEQQSKSSTLVDKDKTTISIESVKAENRPAQLNKMIGKKRESSCREHRHNPVPAQPTVDKSVDEQQSKSSTLVDKDKTTISIESVKAENRPAQLNKMIGKKRESSCREHRHNPVPAQPTVDKSVDEQQSKSSTLVDKDKTTISIESVKAENRPAQLNKMIGKKRESSCREHRHNPVPAQPTVDKSVDEQQSKSSTLVDKDKTTISIKSVKAKSRPAQLNKMIGKKRESSCREHRHNPVPAQPTVDKSVDEQQSKSSTLIDKDKTTISIKSVKAKSRPAQLNKMIGKKRESSCREHRHNPVPAQPTVDKSVDEQQSKSSTLIDKDKTTISIKSVKAKSRPAQLNKMIGKKRESSCREHRHNPVPAQPTVDKSVDEQQSKSSTLVDKDKTTISIKSVKAKSRPAQLNKMIGKKRESSCREHRHNPVPAQPTVDKSVDEQQSKSSTLIDKDKTTISIKSVKAKSRPAQLNKMIGKKRESSCREHRHNPVPAQPTVDKSVDEQQSKSSTLVDKDKTTIFIKSVKAKSRPAQLNKMIEKKRESSCRGHRHNPVPAQPTGEKSVDEQQSKSSTLVDKDKTTISIKSVKAESRPAQLNKMIGKKRESSCREHRHNPVPAQPTGEKSVDEQQSKSSTLVDKDKTTISIKSVKAESRPAQLNKMILGVKIIEKHNSDMSISSDSSEEEYLLPAKKARKC